MSSVLFPSISELSDELIKILVRAFASKAPGTVHIRREGEEEAKETEVSVRVGTS